MGVEGERTWTPKKSDGHTHLGTGADDAEEKLECLQVGGSTEARKGQKEMAEDSAVDAGGHHSSAFVVDGAEMEKK